MSVYTASRDVRGTPHVNVDGLPLPVRLDLYRHSPTGFEWGYAGSGPAQLALAILAHHFVACPDDLALVPSSVQPDEFRTRAGHKNRGRADAAAVAMHQRFKAELLAGAPKIGWKLASEEISRWIETQHPPLVAVAKKAVAP